MNRSLSLVVALMLMIVFLPVALQAAEPAAVPGKPKMETKPDEPNVPPVDKTTAPAAEDAELLKALNTWTAKELKQINGISKAIAEAMVETRKKSPFKSVEDLLQVQLTNRKKEVKPAFLTKSGTPKKSFALLREKMRFHFSDEKLDLQKAPIEKLMLLPGISKATAKMIDEARRKKALNSFDDLLKLKNKNGNYIFLTKTGKPKKHVPLIRERLHPIEETAVAPGKTPPVADPGEEGEDEEEDDEGDDQ